MTEGKIYNLQYNDMRTINAILTIVVFNICQYRYIVKLLMESQEKHSLISDTHTSESRSNGQR